MMMIDRDDRCDKCLKYNINRLCDKCLEGIINYSLEKQKKKLIQDLKDLYVIAEDLDSKIYNFKALNNADREDFFQKVGQLEHDLDITIKELTGEIS